MLQLLRSTPLPKRPDSVNIAELRQGMAAQEQMRYDASPHQEVLEEVMTLPMRDGHHSEIRIYKASQQPGPLVALAFGGGFIAGSNKQMSPFARAFAATYGAVVVNISYRCAPDFRFPIAAYDAWDSLDWLASNAASIGADPTAGFVLGGVSAGGNLAVVTAQKTMKQRLAHPLTGIWACIPVTLAQEIVPEQYKDLWFSREQNADAPMLNAAALKLIGDNYEPDYESEDFSPFNSTVSFAGLPRTFVQVDGLDPLRDDGLVYEMSLREHGVKTRLDVYPGMPHAHWGAFPDLKQSKKVIEDIMEGMGWLLGQRKDRD